jgi:hypothetical protein
MEAVVLVRGNRSAGGYVAPLTGNLCTSAGDSEANVDRRERLRKLAMETIDLAKVSTGH